MAKIKLEITASRFLSASGRALENTQVYDEAQQSKQNKMPNLVAVRKIIDPAEITHMSRIGEDDNQNNKQPEENRPAFHKILKRLTALQRIKPQRVSLPAAPSKLPILPEEAIPPQCRSRQWKNDRAQMECFQRNNRRK